MTDNLQGPYRCPNCAKMVFPIINVQDPEQKDDFPWAECPECHFCTGNMKTELEAVQFFKQKAYEGDLWTASPSHEYEFVFEKFWAPLLINKDGSPNIDQVKRELHDLYTILSEAKKTCMHVQDGIVFKISSADRTLERLLPDIMKESVEIVATPEWLWNQFMEWCTKRGYSPSDYSDLFNIVGSLRGNKVWKCEKCDALNITERCIECGYVHEGS